MDGWDGVDDADVSASEEQSNASGRTTVGVQGYRRTGRG